MQCRRVQSADGLSNTLPKRNQKNSDRISSSTLSLSPEEIRSVKVAKAQFNRRGGFVRIFPTADSWAKYSTYLDPVSGVPISGTISSTYNLVIPHNFNLMLYQQLFPEVQVSKIEKLNNFLDSKHDVRQSITQRQNRYERKLIQGHKAALLPKKVFFY